MRVSDNPRVQRLSADQAYERFFDGYYNLGCPGEVFVGTMVLSPPPVATQRRIRRKRVRKNPRNTLRLR